LIIDDYAHHPAEIEATLKAADDGFSDRRIIAVFQPHRYTRLRDCWDGFCSAFQHADMVLVCPVYAAGEEPLAGFNHETVTVSLRERGQRGVSAMDSLAAATAELARRVQPGDVVITLGAGNVNEICSGLIAALEQA